MDIENLDQLVLSDDEADLRLAAHLFLTGELSEAGSEQLLARLADPRVAQFMADAVRLETIGFEATALGLPDVSPQLSDRARPAAVSSTNRLVAMRVFALSLAILLAVWAWHATPENDTKFNADRDRVAEIWAHRLVQPMDADVQAADENGFELMVALADFGGREAVGLEPPSWLLTATSYTADETDQEVTSQEDLR
jgi:hypothetical protein